MPSDSRPAPASRPQWIALGLALYSACSLVSMAVMSIGIGFVLLGFLVGFGSWKSFREACLAAWAQRTFRLYVACSFALSFACLLSLIGAKLAPLGFAGKSVEVSILKDMAKAWYLFWPLPLAIGLQSLGEEHRKWVLRTWLGAFAILSLIGIAQFFTGWPRPQRIPSEPDHFHATLFLGHHLSVASIFIFPFFVALDLLRSQTRAARAGLSRPLLAVAVLLGGACLFLGYSRMLWVALPIGILIWAVWSLPRRWAIGSVVALVIAALGALQVGPIRDRALDGMGIGTRTELWKANLEFFKLRPWTGAGWHHNLELSGYYLTEKHPGVAEVFSGHAHNNAIEMLGSTGALGFVAWFAWCLMVLALLWPLARDPRSGTFARGLVCAWLVFQINGLTQVNFWESKVLHQIAIVVAWSLASPTLRRDPS